MSRRLVYDVAASLDGYISGPDGALGSFLMEGPHSMTISIVSPNTIPL